MAKMEMAMLIDVFRSYPAKEGYKFHLSRRELKALIGQLMNVVTSLSRHPWHCKLSQISLCVEEFSEDQDHG